MPSFGEKLKQEREKRKITLEQISVSTKIGTRMLQALEEDKFNQLPGGIFNKGFVRAYSRFVGLDEDQTVADYLQASGDAPPVQPEPGARADAAHEHDQTVRENLRENQDRSARPESRASERQLPWGLFAAGLLVIALALSIWSHHRREHAPQPVPPTTSEATQSVGAAAPGSTEASGEASGAASKSKEAAGVLSSTAAERITASKSSEYLSPAAPGEFTVLIQAREESWISVTSDGKSVASELLPADTERAFHGRKELIVRLGNAGGVDLQFNGKKLSTIGEYGEVKTVTFGPDGERPNAPEPTTNP
ncbi:MAG: RodZ domain-containing protein [Terriglobales bacterium]